MKHTLHVLAVGALGFGLAACGGGTASTRRPVAGSPPVTEVHTDRTALAPGGQRAVREIRRPPNHQRGRTLRRPDAARRDPELHRCAAAAECGASAATTARRSRACSIPNWITADLSQTGGAAYLGNETGGATSATQSTFGGRAITDDVIDDLARRGVRTHARRRCSSSPKTTKRTTASRPTTSRQRASQAPTATFPYLAAPH